MSIASIRDVAKTVGVSTAKISRVINIRAGVSEAVRARVLPGTKDLRYVPDFAARTMTAGRTNRVGVLLPDMTHTSALEAPQPLRKLPVSLVVRSSCSAAQSRERDRTLDRSRGPPTQAVRRQY